MTDTAKTAALAPRLMAKGRREARKAAVLERCPTAVEAVLGGMLAFEKLCRFYEIAPAAVGRQYVHYRMAVDSCSARIVIEIGSG